MNDANSEIHIVSLICWQGLYFISNEKLKGIIENKKIGK